MEQWSLEHYIQPVLHAPFLEKNDTGLIEIGENVAEFEITSTDPEKMFAQLLSLKKGDQKTWRQFNEASKGSDEYQILSVLHEYGFIRETFSMHTPIKKAQLAEAVLAEAIEALQPWKDNLQKQFGELHAFIEHLDKADIVKLINTEKNAFLLYCKTALLTWNQLCPPAVNLTQLMLLRLKGGSASSDVEFNAFWSGEARKCLTVIVWALVRSLDKDSVRKTFPEFVIDKPDSGTNLALRLERWAKDSLELFGEAKFPVALRNTESKEQKVLFQAVYAQEYYITDRFVDLVSNAMALRLPPPLKKLLRRYYNEEIGHEAYELRTCLSLGLDSEELHSALPTPFAQLLCDTYTWLAGHHVVAYAAAATITEGLPGQPNVINEAVASSGIFPEEVNESSRKHEILNEKLAHPYISRLLLAECGEQSIEVQEIARDCYGLLLEMTWRTWEELEKLHVQSKRPALNFSMRDFLSE